MPYNSAATRTKTSDSMVAPCPPSRPHPKVDSGSVLRTGIETARHKNGYGVGACTRSFIMMDTGWASIVSGRFNF